MKRSRRPVPLASNLDALPVSCRPLQMVHGLDQWPSTTAAGLRERLRALQAAGLGGIVVSVSTKHYLRDPAAWALLRRGVRLARRAGLRVWVYDEAGYPSGAAGGRVFDRAPGVEATGLVRTAGPGRRVRYTVTRLYEGTHATENFYEKRPYINLLDPRAVREFIAVTHRQYAKALRPIARYVEAFFTDEPSLIAAYIPKGRTYPLTLPWHERLPAEFKDRTGYDLRPHLESLFVDTGPKDRKIRCDFWSVIAALCAETYFGALRRWCGRRGVASSGHLLGEETLYWQTMFNGEPFACYRQLDIPGIDMITSQPRKIMREGYFMVPKVAGSACRLQGRRRLMCEISDFFGIMGGRHATPAEMQCTAAILFACGVTDLCSYYSLSFKPKAERKPHEIPPATYRKYTSYVTRLNAWFTAGRIAARVAVLYPITSFHAGFTPSPRSMYEPHPKDALNRLDRAFTRLCRDLLARRIGFDIVDETSLAAGRCDDRELVIGQRRYEAVVLPPMETIRQRTMAALERFATAGGTIVAHAPLPRFAAEGPKVDAGIVAALARLRHRGALRVAKSRPAGALLEQGISPECKLTPATRDLLCTRLDLPGSTTWFLMNPTPRAYRGRCTLPASHRVTVFDPATGRSRSPSLTSRRPAGFGIELTVPPFGSLFISSPGTTRTAVPRKTKTR